MSNHTHPIPNLTVKKIGTRNSFTRYASGFVTLPCWNGYFLKEDLQYSIMDKMVTDGHIDLTVNCAIDADNSIYPMEEQVNAYHYLIANQEAIKQAILQSLKETLPVLLEDDYGSWDHEDGGFPQPEDLTPAFNFKRFIGPSSIEITEDVKEHTAYLHWYFACRWDPEHGFQVVTHKDRVIDLSPDADVFKIYKDNGTYEQVDMELKDKVWVGPPKKKWWQFW